MRKAKEIRLAGVSLEAVLLTNPDNTMVSDALKIIDWVLGVDAFPFHESVRPIFEHNMKESSND